MKRSYTDLTSLLLRLAFGGMMIPHGIKKINKLGGALSEATFADPLGVGGQTSLLLAIFSEIVCATLVILGVKVRLSTLPLIATMAIAAFVVHGDDGFAKQEPALLFLAGYLAIFLLGKDKYSVWA